MTFDVRARVRVRATLLLLALGTASTLVQHPARAEEAPADTRLEAKRYFEAAQQQYRNKDFVEALESYTRAYELFPRPEFLFNIGQCHRNLNEPHKALYFYEKYLEEISDPGERQRVSDLIMSLNIPRSPGEASPPAPPPPPSEPGAPRTVPTSELSLAPTPSPPLAPPPKPESSSLVEKWWFWTLIGVGAAAVAGGVVLAVSSGGDPPRGSIGTFDYR